MKERFCAAALLGVLALLLFPFAGQAQDVRSEELFYVKPSVGITLLLADKDTTPFNAFDEGTPLALGLEVGYQFSPTYTLGFNYQYGDYPEINQFNENVDTDDTETVRHSFMLVARYLFGGDTNRLAPYIQAGLQYTHGNTLRCGPPCTRTTGFAEGTTRAFGPLIGVGLDYAATERFPLQFGLNSNLTFPDDAADGWTDNNNFGPADFLNQLTLGFKFNLGSNPIPPMVMAFNGPNRLVTGEAGSFTGSCNADATEPVTYSIDFGDGTVVSDPSASHTYANAGTYTVTFTCTNEAGTDTRTMSVSVDPACNAAQIVSMTANNMSPDTRTSVSFSANVTGSQPVTYSWDFGDGTTSTQARPSKTYSQPGTVRRTMTINVARYIAPICQTISEMNGAFFDRNSSTLTAEARIRLQENLDILATCPCLNVNVVGYAAPGERNAQQLSEDRARAVEQFYVDNGVAASRLLVEGRGRVQGTTSKKEGTSQYRRADSLPINSGCN